MSSKINVVVTGDQSLTVAIKNSAGTAASAFTDGAFGTAITLPKAITATTAFWLKPDAGSWTVDITRDEDDLVLLSTVVEFPGPADYSITLTPLPDDATTKTDVITLVAAAAAAAAG